MQDGSNLKGSGILSFRRIFSFTRKTHLVYLVPAILLAALAGTAKPISSILVGKLITSFSKFAAESINSDDLLRDTKPVIFALLVLGAYTCFVQGSFCFAWIAYGELQAKVVREELFSSLVTKDFEWFEAQESGVSTLLSRIQIQIQDFQLGVSQPLGSVILTISQAICSLGVAFYYNWKLALVLLATFPIIAFGLSFLSAGLQEAGDDQHDEMTKATKQTTHTLNNFVILKCYNGLQRELDRYDESLRLIFGHYRNQAQINARQIAFMRIAGSLLVLIAFSFGAYLIHNARGNPGEILSTFWCCVTASKAFDDILVQMLVLEKGRAGAMALRSLINRVKKGRSVLRHDSGETPSSVTGDIEFEDVAFVYPSNPQRQVLRHINLFFPARQTTFVVGQSGSGKSTIGNILLKLYSIQSGQVTIDGVQLRSLNTKWLRNNVTLVQQDSVLFNDTIERNIALGCRDPDQLAGLSIANSVKFAMLDDTIESLPNGIHTKVGKGGSSLSGGQRQRIALARARLRDTAILILDESTSALDTATRVSIMSNIRTWRKGRTTIIITHDISQIQPSDSVYVLRHGTVSAKGQRSDIESFLRHDSHRDSLSTAQEPWWERRTDQKLAQRDSQDGVGIIYSHISPSEGSLEGGVSDEVFEDDVALLQHNSILLKKGHRGKSLRALLRTGNSSLQHESRGNTGTADSLRTQDTLDVEFEMSRIVQSRKVRNRLTMTQAIRPYSIYPTLPSRPIMNEDETLVAKLQLEDVLISKNIQIAETGMGCPINSALAVNEIKKNMSVHSILLTFWTLLRTADLYRLLVALALAIVYSITPSISSWFLVHLFQTFYQADGWEKEVKKWSSILVSIAIIESMAAFLIHFLFETLAQRWINSLRHNALDKVLEQPKSWFDGESWPFSEINTTLDRAAEEMRNLVGRFVPFILIAIVMISIAAIWCFVTCWKLTLVGIGCAPAVYIVSKVFELTSIFWEARTTDSANSISDVFAESFIDVRTVRVLTLESHLHKKYMATTSHAFMIGLRRSVAIGVCFGISDGTVPFLTAGIFQYAVVVAHNRGCSMKDVLVVLSLLISTMVGASAILAFIPQISSSIESASRLLQLVNLPLDTTARKSGLKIDSGTVLGDINFCNVNFTYPTRPEAVVLKKLDLRIRAGQCTVIAGASGSGKSTILSLILGLYSIDATTSMSSSITISGRDLNELNIQSVRSHIAYVPQQPVLFPASIRENILYGVEDPTMWTEDRMHSAARSAGIHDFIESLPDSYDTLVGDGGLNVSGGQAQRIVVARALARRPQILLMDEPTSALDPENSSLIRKSILDYKRTNGESKPTIVIVTHSREMMMVADNVAVFEAGRIVEEGPPADLLRRRGKLFNLVGKSIK